MQKNKLYWLLFALLTAGFIAITLRGVSVPQPGDENVYVYMGRLTAEGAMPYRDFFYAHPPLHIFILAAIYKIFGFNIIAMKMLPLASTVISALLIFLIANERFGRIQAVLSAVLFLFSYSILFNSVFSFGVSTAVMLMLFGFYFYQRGKFFWSGIFLGIAGMTKFLTLMPSACLLAFLLMSDRNKFWRVLAGFSAVFVTANLILIGLFGADYINPVYKYHFLKSYEKSANISEYINVVKLNWILFLTAALSMLLREKKRFAEFGIIILPYLLFLAVSSRIYNFYFIAVFPFMAMLGGSAIFESIKIIKPKIIKISIILILIGIFLWDTAANAAFLNEIGYRGFSRGNDIIDAVNKAPSHYTLFGDDSATPLIALMTGREIASNIVDTNTAVFKTGIVSIKKTLKMLEGKEFIFVVRNKQGISELIEVRKFLSEKCSLLSSFNDRMEGAYILYKCG